MGSRKIEQFLFIDLNNLIESFVLKNSYKFNDFIYLWCQHYMRYLFNNKSKNQILQTTNAVLNYCKRILCIQLDDCPHKHILRRIGGLFLMYIIYNKQPYKECIKIDLSLQSWIAIKKFINDISAIDAAQPACLIFWTLCKTRAFKLAASNFDRGLENLVNYDEILINVQGRKLEFNLDAMIDILPSLMKLEQACNESKTKINLCESLHRRAIPKLNIISEMNEEVQRLIKENHQTDANLKKASAYDKNMQLYTKKSRTIGKKKVDVLKANGGTKISKS